VRRKVALKVLKAGMDTRQVLARFEAERQALALMDHPNIAQVFDGGATVSGRPYIVMELVKGVPITEFCDQHRLTPRQRLELFVSVCRAVQHAHQKGVIHRDLKPSNVLVARHDTTPVVKVIDFGVAKALGQKLTDKTLFTGIAQMVGTPLYMSPEQAGMSDPDVDTRSDVYSLGVLLYELLTGTTPFGQERFKGAGYDEIRRIIREEEPARPSTRLSTLGQAAATVSANRESDPRALSRLLRGELDWIVMKALEKDRGRRYETANGFAMDIQRYLANEPVLACPPSAGYRLRKFVRRNKGPVLAASLLVVVLVAGIIGTTWGMLRAKAAEAEAVHEAGQKTKALDEKEAALTTAKTNEIQAKAAQKDAQENLKDALAAVDHLLTRVSEERVANVPQMEPLRRDLLQDALKFYQKFLQRKSDDPVIRRETAQAYRRVAGIHRQLGHYDESTNSYQKALELLEELCRQSPGDPELRCQLVTLHLNASLPLIDEGKQDKAASHLRRAFQIAEDLAREYPARPAYGAQLAWTANQLVRYVPQTRPEEAERILRRSLDLERRAPDPDLRARTYAHLGKVLAGQRRYAQAEEAYRESLALMPDNVWTLRNLTDLLAADGRQGEAEELCRRVVALLSKPAADYPSGPHWRGMLADAHFAHANLLKELKRTAEAEKAYRHVLDLYEKLARDFPTLPHYRTVAFHKHLALAQFLEQAGRAKDAEEVYSKATTLLGDAPDLPNRLAHKRGLVSCHIELARLLSAGGKALEAQTAFDRAVAIQQSLEKDFADKPEFRRELASAHYWAAHLLHQAGRAEESERFYHLAEAHWRQLVAEAPKDVEALRGLALTYHNRGVLLPREREAEAFAHASETWTKLLALAPADVGARAMKGHGHRHLALNARSTSRPPEEAEHCRAAIQLFGALHAEFPDDTGYWSCLASTQRWLGRALGRDNKPQEAEGAFRRAIELYEGLAAKFPNSPDTPGELSLAYSDLGYQLAASGRTNAAEEFLHQAVVSFSKGIELNAKVWWAWNGRGEARAQLKEWDKAGGDFAKAVELAPQHPLPHYRHALARLALADTRHFRDVCAGMLTRFGTSSDPNAAFWTVWTCGLAPDAVADWGPVVQLAEKAVADDPNNCDKLLNLGAVLYRAGRYPEAAKRLAEAGAAFAQTQSPRASPVYTRLFLAMTLHRLGRSDEAHQQLRKAGNDIDQPPEETKIANGTWNRRLTLRLLRQEAEALLKKSSQADDQEQEKQPD
jgi:serine/threonine protein kinase